MTLDPNGNLGVGVATPLARLHVGGATFRQSDATNSYGYWVTTSAPKVVFSGINGSSYFSWQTANSGADQMTLDVLGNLGIGAAPAGARLAISGGSLASAGGYYGLHFAAGLTTGRSGAYDASRLASIHGFYDDAAIEVIAGTAAGYYTGISMVGKGGTLFSNTVRLFTNGAEALRITGAGRIQDGAGNELGYKGMPQNAQSAAYNLVLADAGKSIYHPASDAVARTFTIPANASVAYDIGTCINFDNEVGAGAVTIAITTDTLVLDGTGATGSRTLAAGGTATARKVTSTRWRISGVGLT
jgi:hypothetical protein